MPPVPRRDEHARQRGVRPHQWQPIRRNRAQAHQIADKSKAIRECATCHSADASPFQSVTLTIAGPDGRPLRHGVEKGVLNSLTSIDSVRGFYAIGANRIRLLDHLLIPVVAGAALVPIAHMTVLWMFRRVRAKVEAERAAASAGSAPPRPDGDREAGDSNSR